MAEPRRIDLRAVPVKLEDVRGREVLTVRFLDTGFCGRIAVPKAEAVAAFRARELLVSLTIPEGAWV